MYTEKFLDIMKRVSEAVKVSEDDARLLFFTEVSALGWQERLQNLYRIKGKLTGEFNLFCPNKDQLNFITTRSGHDLILKSRQIGFTTLMCIYNYDRALWDKWDTGIMSHLRERTELIFEIVKNCNEWFKNDWGKLFERQQTSDSSHKISFVGGGSVAVSYDFQSLTLRSLHISEAAFIDNDRISNSIQSVPENGEVTMESTPNGRGGFFYDSWSLFKKNGSLAPYKGFFFQWHRHYPEDVEKWEAIAKDAKMNLDDKEIELKELYDLKNYHLAWRRWKIQESFQGDEEKFEVHYPSDDVSCFLSGENRFFSASVLKYQESFVTEPAFRGQITDPIGFKEHKIGPWDIWEKPALNTSYVMGVDCSEGIGKDASVISVWNRNTGSQVAELRIQASPAEVAEEAFKAAVYFKQAWICPEVNFQGLSFLDQITHKYNKIYKRKAMDAVTKTETNRWGFYTTHQNKFPITDHFLNKCRNGEIKIRSKYLIDEMSMFVQIASKSGSSLRREAASGCHDDAVMAACLAWEMDKTLGKTIDNNEFWIKEQESKQKFDEETGFIVPLTNDV